MNAPLVIVNARLWPSPAPGADALLVSGGRLVAAGGGAAIEALAPGGARLDARGASVTPGLCDAHIHFVPWAQGRRQLDLAGVTRRAEALERIREALARDRSQAPLLGRGWDEAGWEAPPDRAALDALAPSRPVVLHRHDFHTVWANSAALRAAGVSRTTADPEGGRFPRDAAGEPTGLAFESATRAFAALGEAAGPAITDELLDEGAAALHACGITAVHDFQREAPDFRRMRALAGRGRLRVLQHVGPAQMDELAAAGAASGIGDEGFRIGALKLFADGTLGSRTASMCEPFSDRGGLGMALLGAAELREMVARATALGFACAIHAIGDRAVRDVLDAFSAAGPAVHALALPPRIEHAQLVTHADLSRFAALGVTASMQPVHAVTDAEAALAGWGAERCEGAYAWRSLLDAGASLAFGSDAPVESPAPWLGLHAALTRCRADGRPRGGFVPAQRIGLAQALHAYTAGAARLAGHARSLGTLEPGAQADLVVWDRDLFAAPADSLALARPAVTVLGGKIVYVSPESGVPAEAAGAAGSGGKRS